MADTTMADARKLEEDGAGAEDSFVSLRQTESSSDCFHRILHSVGSFGKWQWKMFIVASSCGVFVAFHNLAAGKCLVSRTVTDFGCKLLLAELYAKYP